MFRRTVLVSSRGGAEQLAGDQTPLFSHARGLLGPRHRSSCPRGLVPQRGCYAVAVVLDQAEATEAINKDPHHGALMTGRRSSVRVGL
jgi:hypothetical protein